MYIASKEFVLKSTWSVSHQYLCTQIEKHLDLKGMSDNKNMNIKRLYISLLKSDSILKSPTCHVLNETASVQIKCK